MIGVAASARETGQFFFALSAKPPVTVPATSSAMPVIAQLRPCRPWSPSRQCAAPSVHGRRSDQRWIIQTIQQVQGGSTVFYLNNDAAYYSPFDLGDGTYTDHLQGETDPFYNHEDKTSTDASTWKTGATESTMTDGPRTNNSRGERFVNFKTAPFALSGKDKGEFFGTFTWGYAVDSAGVFTLRDAQAHDDITSGFGTALRKFIAHQGDLTKTGTTPAPIQLELPIDVCRELTTAEKALLDPFATFAKVAANAKARVWMTSRYDSSGFGAEANHAMAVDNLKGVQKYLTDHGVNLDKIRLAATEEPVSPKKAIGIVDVTIINT